MTSQLIMGHEFGSPAKNPMIPWMAHQPIHDDHNRIDRLGAGHHSHHLVPSAALPHECSFNGLLCLAHIVSTLSFQPSPFRRIRLPGTAADG